MLTTLYVGRGTIGREVLKATILGGRAQAIGGVFSDTTTAGCTPNILH